MNDESNVAVQRTLLTAQIIGVALVLGVAIFLAVILFVRQDKPPAGNEMISYFGVVFAIMAMGAATVVPTMAAKAGVKSLAEAASIESLAGVFQTSTIIRGALIEGAAFLNGTFFLIYGEWLSFAVTGILLAALIFYVPTRARFLDWLQQQRESSL